MTNPGRLPGRHTLLAVAGVLFAAIAAALMPPPAALAEAGTRWGVAALVSAAIVAAGTLPFLVWRSAARPALWIALAVAALAAGVASFVVSGYAERACTARYAGKPVVIGTQLTPLGAAYRQANPELASDDLLFDAAGVPERIWTPSSIGRCRAVTGSTYFLAIPFLVVCLLATAQAVPTTILSPVRWGAAASPASAAAAPVQYDVFVSYRHDPIDRAFVTELVAALEADGYRAAIDERDFPANASFLLEMERCIRESRFTLAVISSRTWKAATRWRRRSSARCSTWATGSAG